MKQFDVVIVGSGPAGISTALSLQKIAPDLAARTVVLEKARHPRHKLCGGGATIRADPVLRWLELDWERLNVPHVPIHRIHLRFEGQDIRLDLPNMFRIVRRDQFDARLAEIARQRGIEVREDSAVSGLRRSQDGVVVQTPAGDLDARIVVGADGAKSVVRRWMGLPGGAPRVSRLLEVLTPEDAKRTPEFVHNYAVFDFTAIRSGLQGYLWDFPSYVEGQAMMNRGVFDARILPTRPRAGLVPLLDSHLRERQRSLADCELQGHPERIYDPQGVYSVPHVLLAGVHRTGRRGLRRCRHARRGSVQRAAAGRAACRGRGASPFCTSCLLDGRRGVWLAQADTGLHSPRRVQHPRFLDCAGWGCCGYVCLEPSGVRRLPANRRRKRAVHGGPSLGQRGQQAGLWLQSITQAVGDRRRGQQSIVALR